MGLYIMKHFLCLVIIAFWALSLQASTPKEIVVCSWNVQNFGVTDRMVDGKRVPKAMKPESEIESMLAILKRINPDILGVSEILQEPSSDLYLKLFRTKLKEAGLDYPYMTTVKGSDARIQNALFSRFPFASEEHLNTESFEVSMTDKKTKEVTKRQFKVGRGFINVVVQVTPTLQIRTMVAHLKSKRPYPELNDAATGEPGESFVRRNEALILKNAMNRYLTANPEIPLLAMGDFNDDGRSKAIQTIIGPKDATVRIFDLWLTDYFGDWWTHFYFPEKSYSRIDYIFVSQPLFSRFVKEKSFVYRPNQTDHAKYNSASSSDHRPLVADFSVEDQASSEINVTP